MLAIKANKVYKVDEMSKASYLAQGFDICDDKGKLIERSPSATVPAVKLDEANKRIAELEAELAALKSEFKTEKKDGKKNA